MNDRKEASFQLLKQMVDQMAKHWVKSCLMEPQMVHYLAHH